MFDPTFEDTVLCATRSEKRNGFQPWTAESEKQAEEILQKRFGLTLNDTELSDDEVLQGILDSGENLSEFIDQIGVKFDLAPIDTIEGSMTSIVDVCDASIGCEVGYIQLHML